MVPLYCGGSSLWVQLDKWLVNVSWLGKLALVFWWVELDLFSLECNEVSSSEFLGVYDVLRWVWCDFWLPVFVCLGLCSCVVGELASYALL